MINAGAITVTALLHRLHGARSARHICSTASAPLAGRMLTIDRSGL